MGFDIAVLSVAPCQSVLQAYGHLIDQFWSPLTDVIPIQGMANSPHLDFAGDIRAATEFPTFHAAKIPDVATARHAIASGKVDMVGMTRAHITDPHIVRKIIEKREDKIRPCVGANYCLDRSYQGGILNDIVKTLFVS